jgi:hypothetical protein
MANFDTVLELINTDERKNFEADWGELKYHKYGADSSGEKFVNKLFANIKKVAANSSINTVLFRHSDVFKYVGEGRVIGYAKARAYLLKILSALYYPEENLNFVYEGNPLRKILEYLFRGANKHGLLPDDLFDSSGHITILDASRFMAGLNTKERYGTDHKQAIRWGKAGEGREGAGGDSIFPSDIALFVKNIQDFSSSDSHTDEDEPYVINEAKKEIFFGYVLQLCHVIKWFGEYVNQNPDAEVNKRKYNIVGFESPAPKKVETKKEIPSKDSLIETEARIMSNDKGHLACGDYCKIDNAYRSSIGRKVVIRKVEDNPGSSAKYLPYIATEIEVID